MNRHPDPWLLIVIGLLAVLLIFIVFDLILTMSPHAFDRFHLL